MKKHSTKKRTVKAEANVNNILYEYQGLDVELLMKKYADVQSILDRLCEVSTNIHTYEFLSDIFFGFTVNELAHDPPEEAWIRKLKNVRFDIMEMYELARAAKALKYKSH